MMRSLLLLCALVAALPVRAQVPDGLAGTWTLYSAVVVPDASTGLLLAQPGLRTVTFSTSGTAIVRIGVFFEYQVEGDSLQMEIGGNRERLSFTLDADTLTVHEFGNGLAHVRVGGSTADGIVGFWRAPGGTETDGLELLPEGQGALIFDSVSPFSVRDGELSIAMDLRNGPPAQDFTLRLDGDTLELAQDGASGTFTRTED